MVPQRVVKTACDKVKDKVSPGHVCITCGENDPLADVVSEGNKCGLRLVGALAWLGAPPGYPY